MKENLIKFEKNLQVNYYNDSEILEDIIRLEIEGIDSNIDSFIYELQDLVNKLKNKHNVKVDII